MKKGVDGVLGTRTRGDRMVGRLESTKLWRHPKKNILIKQNCSKDCSNICKGKPNMEIEKLRKCVRADF